MKIVGQLRKRIWFDLGEHLIKFKKQFIILFVCKICLLLIAITMPLIFKLLINDVMLSKQLHLLKIVIIGYLGLFVFETLILSWQKRNKNEMFNLLVYRIRFKLWKKYLRMPITHFDTYTTGDLKNRIDSDVEVIGRLAHEQTIDYLYFWLLAVSNGVILIITNWKLACFGFLMVPISFWMTRWLGKGLRKAAEDYREKWGNYESWLQSILQGWKEVKTLGIFKKQSKQFTSFWHDLSKLFFKRQMYRYGNKTFIYLKDFFITKMNLYFLGGLLIFNGEMMIGTLLVFMKYYEQFFNAISNITNLDIQLNSDKPSVRRVLEIINDSSDDLLRRKSLITNYSIEFKNVSFGYVEESSLRNITMTLKEGNKIAIVGKSGSGKTTLVKLLLGIYQLHGGSILIGGVDISELNFKDLYKNFATVMQDSRLFNMSIKDNLMLLNPGVTIQDVIKCCKMLQIHEFIINQPCGYDTIVGERGVKLSGGQKQRLLIARALLANRKILVLDEATSNLDQESEKIIYQVIEHLGKEKTVIVIAHRPTSVKFAEQVFILDHEHLVGHGTHLDC